MPTMRRAVLCGGRSCGAQPRARPGQDIVVLRCAAVWRGLKKLLMLELRSTQITDAGCATLVAALDSGALPALDTLHLDGIAASGASIDAATEALARVALARRRS